MKSNIKYILALPLILSLGSCSDFLDKDPLSQITTSGLSYSATECKEYVNQFYGVLNGPFTHRDNGLAYDLGTDNLLAVSYQNNKDLIDGLVTVPASGGGYGINEIGRAHV